MATGMEFDCPLNQYFLADALVLHADKPTQHLHHKANCIGSGNAMWGRP